MPRRRGYWILAFLDKDLDHVGEEAIGFRISVSGLGSFMLRRGLGEEAVGYSSFFVVKAKRLLDFCVIPRQRSDLYIIRISVSGLGVGIRFQH